MPYTEAYKEHIMYTFNGFCKTVIRFAAINAWRDRSRRRQKEISLEYLTEEKFYPFSTTDKYFLDPCKQYPVTICGQSDSAYRQLKKFLSEAGLPNIRFHDLRHPNVKPKTKTFFDIAKIPDYLEKTIQDFYCVKSYRY